MRSEENVGLRAKDFSFSSLTFLKGEVYDFQTNCLKIS